VTQATQEQQRRHESDNVRRISSRARVSASPQSKTRCEVACPSVIPLREQEDRLRRGTDGDDDPGRAYTVPFAQSSRPVSPCAAALRHAQSVPRQAKARPSQRPPAVHACRADIRPSQAAPPPQPRVQISQQWAAQQAASHGYSGLLCGSPTVPSLTASQAKLKCGVTEHLTLKLDWLSSRA